MSPWFIVIVCVVVFVTYWARKFSNLIAVKLLGNRYMVFDAITSTLLSVISILSINPMLAISGILFGIHGMLDKSSVCNLRLISKYSVLINLVGLVVGIHGIK
jgi:hypothetical protein